MHANNDRAGRLVTESIWRISLVLIIFFIFAACLVYLIWLDITRSNYYKEQLEKAKDEAEELSQIKQRFLANMSHEIRTPLQSIIGFAEQLKEHRTNNHEAIEAINSSSEHLLHIVDEVLDYSRISSGSLVFSKENFQLLSLVKEVGAALLIQAERKGLTLLLDIEYADDLTLVGDPFRLRQILYNLVGNAIKFTSKGLVKLGVRTSQHHENVQCVFEVTDTGIGIRKEDLAKIFNQFEQANALITRRFGGTGLGLTIAKSLIEAQGGTLDVTSEPGHGSVFTVNIPFTRSTEVHVLPQLHQQKNNKPLFTGKVIVVDDDVLILRLCSLVLDKNGIQYRTYSDARKLMYEDIDPEVTHILMDIRMPEVNGVELCHALRKKYVPSTRFIALTAHVFPQEHQQLLQEGFDFVMLKPFREQELMSLFGGVRSVDSPVDDASPAIDLSLLNAMTLGDELLLHSILNQFIEETSTDLELLQEYLKREKAGPVREIVHKLAGRTGQVGASLLAGQLRNMENRLADGETLEKLGFDLRLLSEQVQKVLNAIKEKNDALQLAK